MSYNGGTKNSNLKVQERTEQVLAAYEETLDELVLTLHGVTRAMHNVVAERRVDRRPRGRHPRVSESPSKWPSSHP